MTVALFGAAAFALALAIHVAVWQVWVPRRQTVVLLVLLPGTLPLVWAIASAVPKLAACLPTGPWELLHVAIVHVALSLMYIVTYSALAEDSPTLSIVAYLANAGTAGRSRDELLSLIPDEQIAGPRFDGLAGAGIIAPTGDGDRYVLTAKGRRWASLFDAFRRLFRLSKGG